MTNCREEGRKEDGEEEKVGREEMEDERKRWGRWEEEEGDEGRKDG